MNATIQKFGYPDTLVADYVHWMVLVRPAQATLGALVLVNKSDATAFSALDLQAFIELHGVIAEIEQGLTAFRPYDKINYLMLMMVDREVHFHVLPRYAEEQRFDGRGFSDPGWPGAPDLKANATLSGDALARLVTAIRQSWPSSSIARSAPRHVIRSTSTRDPEA